MGSLRRTGCGKPIGIRIDFTAEDAEIGEKNFRRDNKIYVHAKKNFYSTVIIITNRI